MNLKIIVYVAVYLLMFVNVISARSTSPVILKNSWFEIQIQPARGGRIGVLRSLKDGTQWINSGNTGMFVDHLTQQGWPGELSSKPYQCKIEPDTPVYSSVTLKVEVNGGTNRTISGLLLEKQYRIYKSKPLIEVAYRLSNPTDEVKRPGLWIQNYVCPGGMNVGKESFRPTTEGIIHGIFDTSKRQNNAIDFRYDAVSGWLAVINAQKSEGMVFLMDYNYLKCLYCNLGAYTQEWWYDPVLIHPGKSFETTVRAWPVRGLKSVAYADDSIVISARLQRLENETIHTEAAFVPGPDKLSWNNISLLLKKYPGRELIARTDKKIIMKENTSPKVETSGKGVTLKDDVMAEIKLTGASKTSVFTLFDSGQAVLGTETQLRVPRPRKLRNNNPSGNLVKKTNSQFHILHFKGLFANAERWDQIAKAMNSKLDTGYYKKSIFGFDLTRFPNTYEEAANYDIIIFDNVPANALDINKTEILEWFVKSGGILLFYGSEILATSEEKYPEQLLPISPDNLQQTVKYQAPAWLDASFPSAGSRQYNLKINVKPDLLFSGSLEQPVILAKKINKGITAVFCPQNLGMVDQKQEAYWNSTDYPAWAAKTFIKLLKTTDIYGGKK